MKITKEELLEGLLALDPKSDADWTEEGLPSLERIQAATLDDSITRADLSENANGYTRDIALAKGEPGAKAASTPGPADPVYPAPSDLEVAPEVLAELQTAVTDARQALADHDDVAAKMRGERTELVAALDKATKAMDDKFPPQKPAHAIQDWIASEARKREQRVSQLIQTQAPKSPLEQSFERRTGHGHGRKSAQAAVA